MEPLEKAPDAFPSIQTESALCRPRQSALRRRNADRERHLACRAEPLSSPPDRTLAGKWNLLRDVIPDELVSGLDFPVVDGFLNETTNDAAVIFA
jgi:hypothetical protein